MGRKNKRKYEGTRTVKKRVWGKEKEGKGSANRKGKEVKW
jgi:hypothetical protein